MRKAIALCAALSLMGPSSAHVRAQEPLTVTQGDRFYVRADAHSDPATMTSCTVGYNDQNAGTSLTAGHCATVDGDVFLESNSAYGRAGTIKAADSFRLFVSDTRGEYTVNDRATITWDPHVVVGENIYSGDSLVDPDSLTTGDRICFHGGSTHRGTHKYACGPVIGSIREVLYSEMDNRAGDSGAPVWVPGRGFVGVVSLRGLHVSTTTGERFAMTAANVGALSNTAVSDAEEQTLLENYAHWDGDRSITVWSLENPAPHVEPENPTPEVEQSAVGVGEILGIVAAILGVALGVAALIGPLMSAGHLDTYWGRFIKRPQ